MIEKTEKEIMKNWQGDISEPVVSICCITYNHEKYIEEAIDSFLMQETNFPFEVVIGEDCSTDNTRKIVEKYKENYPNIIKLIVSENNVGMLANAQRTMEACVGEYIALCEGDDYWTDKNKLQIQIDEMKKYPKCNISFHPTYEVIDGVRHKILSKYSNKNKIFTTSEVIIGDGGFMPTSSLILKKYITDNMPDWFYKYAPVGDYFIQILGSRKNGALYLPIPMSCYRTQQNNSWSASMKKEQERIIFLEKITKSMTLLDKELDYEYSNEIKKYIRYQTFAIIMSKTINIETKKHFYIKNKTQFSAKEKFLWYIVFSNPNIDKILRFFYEILKR